MPRIVLDTGVVIAGFFLDGPERQLIEAANSGRVELITSDALASELMRAASHPDLTAHLAAATTLPVDLASEYAQLTYVVVMPKSRVSLPRPEHPAAACAATARADFLVTNDPALLSTGSAASIPILSPEAALRRA